MPYAGLTLSVQDLAMKSKKVPPLLLTSDTAGKKTLDSVLDGTQGFEFKEYRRQVFPVETATTVSTPAWFWVTGKRFCQCSTEPRGERIYLGARTCVLPLLKQKNLKFKVASTSTKYTDTMISSPTLF